MQAVSVLCRDFIKNYLIIIFTWRYSQSLARKVRFACSKINDSVNLFYRNPKNLKRKRQTCYGQTGEHVSYVTFKNSSFPVGSNGTQFLIKIFLICNVNQLQVSRPVLLPVSKTSVPAKIWKPLIKGRR